MFGHILSIIQRGKFPYCELSNIYLFFSYFPAMSISGTLECRNVGIETLCCELFYDSDLIK